MCGDSTFRHSVTPDGATMEHLDESDVDAIPATFAAAVAQEPVVYPLRNALPRCQTGASKESLPISFLEVIEQRIDDSGSHVTAAAAPKCGNRGEMAMGERLFWTCRADKAYRYSTSMPLTVTLYNSLNVKYRPSAHYRKQRACFSPPSVIAISTA